MSSQIVKLPSLEILKLAGVYHFYGMIDGTFGPEWVTHFTENQLIFDFEKLTYINSSGVMKFSEFLKALKDTQEISYENIPAIVISQMGLTKGLVSSRFYPKSFYVPYTNDELDDQIYIKLTLDDVKDGKIPPKRHPQNGSMVLADVLESKFLNFLNYLK